MNKERIPHLYLNYILFEYILSAKIPKSTGVRNSNRNISKSIRMNKFE